MVSNVISCSRCGASVIFEEREIHGCRTAMLEGNTLWLRKRDGKWKQFNIPERVMERLIARSKKEGFDLPPKADTRFGHQDKATVYKLVHQQRQGCQLDSEDSMRKREHSERPEEDMPKSP